MGNITMDRVDKLREYLKDKGINGCLISKSQNCFYLSGFSGTSATLLITHDELLLFTDFRYIEQASNQAKLYQVIDQDSSIFEALKKEINRLDIKCLGFEERYITVKQFEQYKEKLTNIVFEPIQDEIDGIRLIKDDDEIKSITQAVKIADDAFSHILKFIKPGITEIDICAEIEYYMKKNGAQGTSFDTIVASGYRAALPHGIASSKKIESGEVITLDFGAVWQGYCSDMTRTVFLGNPDPEIERVYEVVKNAQEKAVLDARENVSVKDLDKIARDVIQNAGYGDAFGHGLGHGVGIDVHEEPRVSPKGSGMLKPGMVITIEPGIYLSGVGGVRIEDMILISKEGSKVLTTSTKEKIIL